MKRELTIDKAGRVVLPQEIRQRFHLLAGDQLDLKILPEGIFLGPRRLHASLVEENGLLVHQGEPAGDLMQAVEWARANRDAQALGLRT